jgi:hypothetical protein
MRPSAQKLAGIAKKMKVGTKWEPVGRVLDSMILKHLRPLFTIVLMDAPTVDLVRIISLD